MDGYFISEKPVKSQLQPALNGCNLMILNWDTKTSKTHDIYIFQNTDRFGRILDDEGGQLMTHVNVANMSTGNATLSDAVLLHNLPTHTHSLYIMFIRLLRMAVQRTGYNITNLGLYTDNHIISITS